MRARQARAELFPQELFSDPGWDILLDLFEARLAHRRLAVSSVCVGAGVPTTTVFRWLRLLEQKELIVRTADPDDARRVFVELSPQGDYALRRWFAENLSDVGLR